MRVSYNWIKELVDITDPPAELARRLTDVGFALESIEAAGNDTVLDFDVPTNRPDCLSHVGIAREAGAIYGAALRLPRFALAEAPEPAEGHIRISIADPDLCGRYCGRYLTGIRVGPSPDWLKARLETLGVRSINNVADATNYVMLELGQPLHAFDAATLKGREIIVRRAELDEKITTLDGVERELNPSMLVIADASRPVALAGVMGGADTEISDTTTAVLLESASFDALSVRRTARTTGLTTEASYRFERGSDIEMARYACDRAAALIRELAGGTLYRGVIDVYPRPSASRSVTLRRARIADFLGNSVDDAIVERIFERLGFTISATGDGWLTTPPSFRQDVVYEEDLLEEVARHHGFDKFPATLPSWRGLGSGLPDETRERQVRNLILAAGYTEATTYSFSDIETERRFRPEAEPVRLLNPMAEDASILRTSLVPGILKTLQWNLNRGIRDLQFYELSKVYRPEGEHRTLILAAAGALRAQSVHEAAREFTFFDMKGDLEELSSAFRLDAEVSANGIPAYYHPGRAARLGDWVVFGELHPDYAAAFKIRQRVYIAEVDVEKVLSSRRDMQVQAIPRFPAIRRDFSLLLNKGTQYVAVRKIIEDTAIPEVVRIEPFDRMESGPFPESQYSLSLSVTYQSPERTLTDAEVESFDQRILQNLEQRLGAQLRK